MATFRGMVRSYGAHVRRMERDYQREAREATKRFKEQQKREAFEDAQLAVKEWNEYVYNIQSLHKNCTEVANWNKIKNTHRPVEPLLQGDNETYATQKLNTFKPSFFDKLMRTETKKVKALKDAIARGREIDEGLHKQVLEEHKKALDDWGELQNISAGVLKREPMSYQLALEYFNPFLDVEDSGTSLSFSIERDYADIYVFANDEEVIPTYELSQTSTGKLSKKNMTKAKFNELYQDHICSVVLRVAREVFNYLPIEKVRVSAVTKLLNPQTGHLEDKPILSAIIPAATLNTLNFSNIDPSDSMRNFVHNMNFKKTTGFSEVKKIELK